MYNEGATAKDDSYLYLLLNSSTISSVNPVTESLEGLAQDQAGDEPCGLSSGIESIDSPPVVLRWKIAGMAQPQNRDNECEEETEDKKQAWRAWADENETSEDVGRSTDEELRMLRGNFVVGTKYYVPFRSGLDWRRQGFLSCV